MAAPGGSRQPRCRRPHGTPRGSGRLPRDGRDREVRRPARCPAARRWLAEPDPDARARVGHLSGHDRLSSRMGATTRGTARQGPPTRCCDWRGRLPRPPVPGAGVEGPRGRTRTSLSWVSAPSAWPGSTITSCSRSVRSCTDARHPQEARPHIGVGGAERHEDAGTRVVESVPGEVGSGGTVHDRGADIADPPVPPGVRSHELRGAEDGYQVRGAGSAVPDGSPIRLRRSRRTPSSQSATGHARQDVGELGRRGGRGSPRHTESLRHQPAIERLLIDGDGIGTECVQGRPYAGRHLLGERH